MLLFIKKIDQNVRFTFLYSRIFELGDEKDLKFAQRYQKSIRNEKRKKIET